MASDNDTVADQEAAIRNEASMYAGPACGLQGSILPRWGGLFYGTGSAAGSWASVLEDVGRAAPSRPDFGCVFAEPYRRNVLKMYDVLHSAGIAHGHVEPRHVRVGTGAAARNYPDALVCLPPEESLGLRLIDLDKASTDPQDVDRERSYVRHWLGLTEAM